MEQNPSGGRFAVALLLFGISLLIAILLLITALCVWLTAVTGSMIASALIVGGFFALAAAGIYLLAIRETLERLRTQAETVYEVARAARSGYEWVLGKVGAALRLYGELQRGPHKEADGEVRRGAGGEVRREAGGEVRREADGEVRREAGGGKYKTA